MCCIGPGPVERHERGQVSEAGRLQLQDGAAHACGLKLKDAERLTRRQHRKRLFVAVGQRLEVNFDAVALPDHLDRAVEDGEVGQAEKVHLDQADRCDVLHRELRRRHGLSVAARRPGQGQVLDQGVAADHDAGGVRAGVARHALEAAGAVDEAGGSACPAS